jgi:hypothetical protein
MWWYCVDVEAEVEMRTVDALRSSHGQDDPSLI